MPARPDRRHDRRESLNATAGALLDTRYAAETPEGIALALSPAGLAPRAWAFAIDLLIRGALLIALGAALAALGEFGSGLMLIAFFAIDWLYPVLFELLPGAATPGKRAVGLRVTMDDGLPVTPAASLLRNLLRSADFMPFLYAGGIACMLLRADGKRLGDVAAGTIVVHRAGTAADPTAAARPAAAAAPPRAPQGALSARAQAAIVGWSSRLGRLTPARADELAALALPAVAPGADPSRRVEVLDGIAQWIVGRRSVDDRVDAARAADGR